MMTCGETMGNKSVAYIPELSVRRHSTADVSLYPLDVSPSWLSSTFPSPGYRWGDLCPLRKALAWMTPIGQYLGVQHATAFLRFHLTLRSRVSAILVLAGN
jgi:hypothetical protein